MSYGKNNRIVKIENVFDKEFISFLYENCQEQLEFNLSIKDFIHITNNIIDCHGLALRENDKVQRDPNFPYCIRNWNLFCIKMQDIMFDYCDTFNLDKSQLSPHSFWAEKYLVNTLPEPFRQPLLIDSDEWLDEFCNSPVPLTHYRIVYFLKNINPEFGIIVYDKNDKLEFPGTENSLYILPTSDYDCHIKFSKTNENQLVLMFDWYFHPEESIRDPTWVFPNKYNYRLHKKYFSLLKNKLTKK